LHPLSGTGRIRPQLELRRARVKSPDQRESRGHDGTATQLPGASGRAAGSDAGLAAGQRRIARVLLADPEATAFRSIGETAKIAEVHESSLVRFAAALGLPGYPALVKLCRQQLAEQAQLVRRFEQVAELTKTEELLGAVVEHDQQNIARTFARLDQASWAAAVDMLAGAKHVHVIGLRKCFTVAYLLTYLLHMVRPGVRRSPRPPA